MVEKEKIKKSIYQKYFLFSKYQHSNIKIGYLIIESTFFEVCGIWKQKYEIGHHLQIYWSR